MSAEAVTAYSFGEQAVRVLGTTEEPLFVAKDVCAALGIVNYKDACRTLDEDEKGVGLTDTPGGRQEMLCVTEPGLYHLIGKSRKADARDFRRWVHHEVLPSIRKTGRYAMGQGERVAERMTLLDWAESLGCDLRKDAWVVKILLGRARKAAADAGFQMKSYREEDGLLEFPVQVLNYAAGLVEEDARRPVNAPFMEHFPRGVVGGGR